MATKAKRGPGRPRKEAAEEDKVKRVPFGGHRSRLQLSQEDYEAMLKKGYTPHWFNDQYGRVQRAQAGGYVFVTPAEAPSIGESQIGRTNTDLADKVSLIVNKDPSNPVRAYLMKIKTEFYEADQKLKEEALKATDEMIKMARVDGSDVEMSYGPGVTFN